MRPELLTSAELPLGARRSASSIALASKSRSGNYALVVGPEQQSAMETYLGRVRGVVVALDGYVSADALDRANRLINHGEPPEGLVTLAWAIVKEGAKVPRWTLDAIYELGDGINDPEHLPANLRDFSE